MGLFSKHEEEPAPAPAPVEEPRRSSKLFGRKADEPAPATVEPRHSSSLFHRSSNSFDRDRDVNGVSHSPSTSSRLSKPRGLFQRTQEDPSIVAARERVIAAEVAEKDADRALLQAKAASQQAREHAKILEREAAEQVELARQKHGASKDISKRSKLLGRHDHAAV